MAAGIQIGANAANFWRKILTERDNNLNIDGERQPLVSVIMPAYNAEKYIAEAIQSVISQTYTNWELFVLDDCSTDGTAEIAEGFARADGRIHLLKNPQNMGVARTRNRGFDLAQGEWIALLDSDDVWHSDKLEKQLEVANESGAEIIYSSYALFTDGESGKTQYNVPVRTNYSNMLKENVIGCSTVLLSKALLENFRFRVDVYHEDYALWLELLRNGYAAAGCMEVLTNYRIVKGSRSNSKLRAAKNRWIIYRKAEKLPLLKAISFFAAYAVNGFNKHKRI